MTSNQNTEEFFSGNGRVAHFQCQCSQIENQYYRGKISKMLSDPLSTIPFLHLDNSNMTILVELSGCRKLKLDLDITDLLLGRSISPSDVDFKLKVSH